MSIMVFCPPVVISVRILFPLTQTVWFITGEPGTVITMSYFTEVMPAASPSISPSVLPDVVVAGGVVVGVPGDVVFGVVAAGAGDVVAVVSPPPPQPVISSVVIKSKANNPGIMLFFIVACLPENDY